MTPFIFSFLGLSAIKWAAILAIVYICWFLYRYLTGQRTGFVTMMERMGEYIYIFLVLGSMFLVCALTYNAFHKNVYAASQKAFKSGVQVAEVVSYRLNEDESGRQYVYTMQVAYENKEGKLTVDEVDLPMVQKPVIGSNVTIQYGLDWDEWCLFLIRGSAVVVSAISCVVTIFIVLLGLGALLFKGSISPVAGFIGKILKKMVPITLLMALIMVFAGDFKRHGYLVLVYIFYNVFIIFYTFFYKAYRMATETTVESPYNRKKNKRKKKKR